MMPEEGVGRAVADEACDQRQEPNSIRRFVQTEVRNGVDCLRVHWLDVLLRLDGQPDASGTGPSNDHVTFFAVSSSNLLNTPPAHIWAGKSGSAGTAKGATHAIANTYT